MSDTAQRGLSAFLRRLAERQAGGVQAAVPGGPGAAAAEEDILLEGQDQKALVALSADITAGCSQEAAAMVPSASPAAPKGLLGLAVGTVQRAWELPATFLGIKAAVRNLAGGGAANDKYRWLQHAFPHPCACRFLGM